MTGQLFLSKNRKLIKRLQMEFFIKHDKIKEYSKNVLENEWGYV